MVVEVRNRFTLAKSGETTLRLTILQLVGVEDVEDEFSTSTSFLSAPAW